MKFTSDSAKVKHHSGTSKDALEEGYEIVPSEGNGPFKKSMADVRLGQVDQWEVMYPTEPYED